MVQKPTERRPSAVLGPTAAPEPGRRTPFLICPVSVGLELADRRATGERATVSPAVSLPGPIPRRHDILARWPTDRGICTGSCWRSVVPKATRANGLRTLSSQYRRGENLHRDRVRGVRGHRRRCHRLVGRAVRGDGVTRRDGGARTRLRDDGYEVEVVREHGDPTEKILEVPDRTEADLIAMGGRQMTPVGKVIFGSTTQAVMLEASRPVLVTMG